MYKKIGFTLAEVLITLGIIGVVAAITIPTLSTKINNAILKAQFKKAHAELMQIDKYVIEDLGLNCSYNNRMEIRNIIKQHFKIIPMPAKNYYKKFYSYTKKEMNDRIHKNCFHKMTNEHEYFYLPSGTFVGLCSHNSDKSNFIAIDLNGPDKMPNAFGHDIFLFMFDLNTCRLTVINGAERSCNSDEKCPSYGWTSSSYPCTNSNPSNNRTGLNCGAFAMKDVCPDDNSKRYFECLP